MNSSQIDKKMVRKIFISLIFPFLILIPTSRLLCLEPESNYESLIREYEEKFAYNPYDKKIKIQLSVFYHSRALELAAEDLLEEAIAKEKRAWELNPAETVIKKTLAYFYNNYGLELSDQGSFQKAVDYMKAALDYFPGEARIRKNTAAVYLKWAEELFLKGEYTNSERMLLNAEHFDESNPYIYILRGEIASSRDNYFKAEENWTRALELDPGLYNLRIKLEKIKQERELERNFNVREVENFRLKFEGLEKGKLAEEAAEILKNAYREVGQDFDFYPQKTVPVIIYPENKLKTLDYFPDWAAGAYDGKIRFGENLGRNKALMKAVLYHEYTHVIVRELGGSNVPLWLNEGLAEFEAQRFKPAAVRKSVTSILSKAVAKETIFSIEKLGSMDLVKLSYLAPHRIELVYAQSESFLKYIIERTSLFDVKRLLEALKNGLSIDQAVRQTFYVDLNTLERDWKTGF